MSSEGRGGDMMRSRWGIYVGEGELKKQIER